MKPVIVMFLVAALLFSGCGTFSLSAPGELMRSPRLNVQQMELENALLDAALGGSVTYKYPQSGEYRSAFIFRDLDMDGQEEALVFYTSDAVANARLAILQRDAQLGWRSVYEIPGAQNNVAFLAFANLSSQNQPDILVGWGNQGVWNRRQLGVYSFQDGALKNLLGNVVEYNAYQLAKLQDDGTDSLLLFTGDLNTGTDSRLRVYGRGGTSLTLLDEVRLSAGIRSFPRVQVGRLTADSLAPVIFVDEQRLDDMLYTEVFRWEKTGLVPVIYSTMVGQTTAEEISATQDETMLQQPTLYDKTGRYDKSALCNDLDKDGVVEIPTETVLLGYEDREVSERIYQVTYHKLDNVAFETAYVTVTNQSAGYRVRFPEKWVNKITVLEQPENNEWRFLEVKDGDIGITEDFSRELLRIRVVSSKDYQDKFTGSYTPLGTRGAFTYYGYLPPESDETLAITMEELSQALFSLI